MLALDKGLAQYSWIVWDVLEMSPLFWTAVIMGLVLPTVHIIQILELSAPQVRDIVKLLQVVFA